MMNRIILILLVSGVLLAQETDNQSIELPDFVITGTQSISIPEANKDKPRVFPSLSQEFFNPTFLPQELGISQFSNPLLLEYNSFKPADYNNGLLILGAGLETLPLGDFYFTQSSEPIMFSSHIYGRNINEYIENAGYNVSGLKGRLDLFTSTKSVFLPGLKISLGGKYQRDNYKLFASNTPAYKRENEIVETLLEFQSGLNSGFKYKVSGKYDILKFKDSDFQEKILTGELFLKSGFGKFGFSLDGLVKNQNISGINLNSDNTLYLSGNFNFLVNSVENFRVKLGVHYSTVDSVKFLSPIASFDLKLDDGINFYGEYSPHTSFNNVNTLLHTNRYFLPSTVYNITTEYKAHVKLGFEFQYKKFFEINTGVSIASVDNYAFYTDNKAFGIYDVNTLDEVNYFSVFINGLFHKGPLGYLYLSGNFNRIKTSSNFNVPFKPNLTAFVKYGFNIYSGLEVSTNLKYYSKSYADLSNVNSIPSFINLGVDLKLNFFAKLDLTLGAHNILNKKNYVFENYQEKPFDIVAGIEYRW
jgi:hypothetical protein